jgi:hypothetical protein
MNEHRDAAINHYISTYDWSRSPDPAPEDSFGAGYDAGYLAAKLKIADELETFAVGRPWLRVYIDSLRASSDDARHSECEDDDPLCMTCYLSMTNCICEETKVEDVCKCGHHWSDHRDKNYDADVVGSMPGRGSCTECECPGHRPKGQQEEQDG